MDASETEIITQTIVFQSIFQSLQWHNVNMMKSQKQLLFILKTVSTLKQSRSWIPSNYGPCTSTHTHVRTDGQLQFSICTISICVLQIFWKSMRMLCAVYLALYAFYMVCLRCNSSSIWVLGKGLNEQYAFNRQYIRILTRTWSIRALVAAWPRGGNAPSVRRDVRMMRGHKTGGIIWL